jgi:hypothetical protein
MVSIGDVFGRWTVVGEPGRNQYGIATATCLCTCGTRKNQQLRNVVVGKSLSCGCLKREAGERSRENPRRLDARTDITHARLTELVDYDPRTGIFTAKVNSKKGRWPAGRELGYASPNSYLVISLDRSRNFAHRLAWFYMTGEWPEMIDHADGNKANNAFSNLRLCNVVQNAANMKARPERSIPKGVRLYRNGTYQARICHNKVTFHLGYYATPEEAHAAYVAKSIELNGAFARAA